MIVHSVIRGKEHSRDTLTHLFFLSKLLHLNKATNISPVVQSAMHLQI